MVPFALYISRIFKPSEAKTEISLMHFTGNGYMPVTFAHRMLLTHLTQGCHSGDPDISRESPESFMPGIFLLKSL